ncbi:MAG: hypothetical protein GY790_17575 [Bacteroidetes bacterium]|nr:hypothetical protein [Bacteroidota bacterium]
MDKENNKNEQLKGQINAIRSGNRTSIMDAMKEIRAGSSTAILPELFDLLMEQEDEEIIEEVSSLLNDLKIQEAAAILAEALENPAYQTITRILTAACWQNGLSYAKYADTFAQLCISADYETAIEAFTVLEEAVGDLEPEEREKLVLSIKHGMSGTDENKKLLLRELVKTIESY